MVKRFNTKLWLILGACTFLPACRPSNSLPVQPVTASASCQSFNKSDDVRSQLDAPSIQVKIPVSRYQDPQQGISTAVLPSTEKDIHLFWAWRDANGNWAIANKQTVVRIKPGELDAQFLHRLKPQVYPRTVLFITLPQDYWDKPIALQPVLEKQESRWGKVENYNVKITAQGTVHPFRGLAELGDSGDKLPPHLNRVMNQIQPGSIYLPAKLSSNVKLLQPILVNPQLCPKSGA